jgi:hypothetical protein
MARATATIWTSQGDARKATGEHAGPRRTPALQNDADRPFGDTWRARECQR